jgi:predicted molibdopterin-dependent oxidoreductase YjgC
MFRRLNEPTVRQVRVLIEGREVRVPAGETVAAAVLASGMELTRTSPVSGAPRAPFCMMGVCFECLMEIDGVPNRRACQVAVAEGMRIRRQRGVERGDW